MNTNDELTKALSNCVNVLQELTQKLEQAQEPEKMEEPKPWTPPEGEWSLNGWGKADDYCTDKDFQNYGNEYTTRKAAEEQAELTKGFQWLCALARELNPSGRCMKPREEGFSVYWTKVDKSFVLGPHFTGIDTVFETLDSAEAAIEIMNRDKDRWKEIVG
jgi:hypothetical protein